jgi:hypothetical protein
MTWLVQNVTCKRLLLCINNFWQKENLNIDCCFNHGHTKMKFKFWNVKNFFTKDLLFTKSKFTECGRITDCLYWSPPGNKKYSLNTGFHCILVVQ